MIPSELALVCQLSAMPCDLAVVLGAGGEAGFVGFHAEAQSFAEDAEGCRWFVSWWRASCFFWFDSFGRRKSFQAAGGSWRALRSFAPLREKKGAEPLFEGKLFSSVFKALFYFIGRQALFKKA